MIVTPEKWRKETGLSKNERPLSIGGKGESFGTFSANPEKILKKTSKKCSKV
jgi:hypothetical protein